MLIVRNHQGISKMLIMYDYNIYENFEYEFLNLAFNMLLRMHLWWLFLPAYRENIFHRDLLTLVYNLSLAIINSRESAWIYRVIILSGMDIF